VVIKEIRREKTNAKPPFTVFVSVEKPKEGAVNIGNVFKALKEKGYDFSKAMVCCSIRSSVFCCGMIEDFSDFIVSENESLQIEYELLTPKKQSSQIRVRTIREVIAIVAEWRLLYVGKMMEDGKIRRYSLEQAAKLIGIPKKTLEDYFLQIRIGRTNGFNFNKFSEFDIGFLRSFVRVLRTDITIQDS